MKLSMRSSFLVGLFLLSLVLVAAGAPPQDAKKEDAKKDAKPAGAQEAKGDPAKGKEIFMANCDICHNADSDEQKVGPGLKGLWTKPPHKMADGTERKEETEESVRNQVVNGSSAMPPIGAALSEKELNDLMAYLHTL